MLHPAIVANGLDLEAQAKEGGPSEAEDTSNVNDTKTEAETFRYRS